MVTQKDDNVVGKSDDYRLCDVCGRNRPIKEIAGKCTSTGCGDWVCDDCVLKCEECNKIYCPTHARKLSERELRKGRDDKVGKTACHICVPKKKGGCFIATAAYGTPFAKEIDTLRFWRDKTLSNNVFGRNFVSFYYFVSPSIADFIADKPRIRKFVRTCLNPYVKFLQNKYKLEN